MLEIKAKDGRLEFGAGGEPMDMCNEMHHIIKAFVNHILIPRVGEDDARELMEDMVQMVFLNDDEIGTFLADKAEQERARTEDLLDGLKDLLGRLKNDLKEN